MGRTASPEIDDGFGLHYPDWFIGWCVDAMRAWHISPTVWLEPHVTEHFILDIIRWINQSDAVRAEREGNSGFKPPPDNGGMFSNEDVLEVTF